MIEMIFVPCSVLVMPVSAVSVDDDVSGIDGMLSLLFFYEICQDLHSVRVYRTASFRRGAEASRGVDRLLKLRWATAEEGGVCVTGERECQQ